MGRDKALLPIGAETFLEHIIRTLRELVSPLVIVLGSHADEIELAIQSSMSECTEHSPGIAPNASSSQEIIILRNPDYLQGQLTSLKAALKYLMPTGASGAIAALVDHPAISAKVVTELLDRFEAGGAPILIPSYKYRRGHPVLFSRSLFQELMDAPIEEGARSVVRRHAAEIEHVEVDDEGVLLDIDYPSDYQAYLDRRNRDGSKQQE